MTESGFCFLTGFLIARKSVQGREMTQTSLMTSLNHIKKSAVTLKVASKYLLIFSAI